MTNQEHTATAGIGSRKHNQKEPQTMTDLTTIEIVVLRNLIDAANTLAKSPLLHDAPIITQPVIEAAEAASELFSSQVSKGFDIQTVIDSK